MRGLEPIPFAEANRELGAPEGMNNCSELPVYSDPDQGFTISCWQFTTEQIEQIQKTGRIWALVFAGGETQPPIALTPQKPFETVETSDDTNEQCEIIQRHTIEIEIDESSLREAANRFGVEHDGELFALVKGDLAEVDTAARLAAIAQSGVVMIRNSRTHDMLNEIKDYLVATAKYPLADELRKAFNL